MQELEDQRQFDICQERQKEMNACIRPTTKTGERLTLSDHQDRRRYTDYDDRKKYHDGTKGGGLYFS